MEAARGLLDVAATSPGALAVQCRVRAAEQQMGAHMLLKRLAFAAFPRLETTIRENRSRLLGTPGLVIKGAEFEREVVAK